MSAGGNYEASLLLIDDIWSSGQVKVNGDIVVAIPTRDVLLVTGSRNRSGLKRVRELAAKFIVPRTVRADRHFVPLSRRALYQIRLALAAALAARQSARSGANPNVCSNRLA